MNFKVKLADLNDFIRQENNCVITANSLIKNFTDDGKKSVISTRDCLACTSCISDAESALLESSSLDTFESILQDRLQKNDFQNNVVISLSSISESYLCTYYKLERVELYAWLNDNLHIKGVDFVCDQDLALHIKNTLSSLKPNKINIQCPVTLLMSEKSAQDSIVSQISTVPSVEVLQAMLIKTYAHSILKKRYNFAANLVASSFLLRRVFPTTISIHVCECYDKKIELFRREYKNEKQEKLIDIIISADELFTFLNRCNLTTDYYQRQKKISTQEILFTQAVLKMNNINYVFQPFNKACYNYLFYFKQQQQEKNINKNDATKFVSGYSEINKLIQTGSLNGEINNELFICDSGCINGAGLAKLYKAINNISKIEQKLFFSPHTMPTGGTEKIHMSLTNFCAKHGFSFCVRPSIITTSIDEW